MSAQQDAVALDWIKGEIRETLSQAQQALDVVADSPDDATSMRLCLTAIHQVHGTLKMVELPGAVQLAAEMEELAQALMNNSVPDVGQAQEVLMQNILQLPGYLDRVQQEHSESPEFIAVTVDDLRVARGESALRSQSGPVELVPNIELINAPPGTGASENYINSGGAKHIRKLRQRYQQSLIGLIKKQNHKENLGLLAKIFTMLAKATAESPISHLSLIGVAVVEGIANGSIELDAKMGSALKHVDPVLKNLIETGEAGLHKPVPQELLNVLIQRIASDAKETNRVLAIKQDYLKEIYTQDLAPAPVDRTLGPDDETMSVVAKVLLEELIVLKDKLDLYVRSSPRSKVDIEALIPGLEKFDSSMTVVGMNLNQQVLQEQADLLKAVLAEADEPPEDVILGIASAFIQVETSLSPLVVPDGSEIEAEMTGDLSEAEASVIKEVRNGLAQCRDSVIDYISSDWDKSKIAELPGQLLDLRGGLLVVNQSRPANALLACAEYVSKGILANSGSPELAAMDDLADSITSIDYYFERYLDKSAEPYLQMLEVAEAGVARLGYSVEDSVEAYQQGLAAAEQEVSAEPIQEVSDPALQEEVEVAETSEEPEIETLQAEDIDSDAAATKEPAVKEPPLLEKVFVEPVVEEVEEDGQDEVSAELAPTEEMELDEISLDDMVTDESSITEDGLEEISLEDSGSDDIETEDVSFEESELEEAPEEDQFEIERAEMDVESQVDTQAEEQISEDEFAVDEIETPEPEFASEDLEMLEADSGDDLAIQDDLEVGEFTLEEIDEGLDSEDTEEDLAAFESEEIELEESQDTEGISEATIEEFGEIEEVSFDDADLGLEEPEPSLETVLSTEESVVEPETVADAVDAGGIGEAAAEEDEIIDDEIIEIFVEEATEVLETIAEFYPTWKVNSADQEALTEIRRAFHTLKGSGRMVGATVVGELAWTIEDMLNKVLDQTIAAGPDMITLMDEVLERIPVMMQAFENKKQHSVKATDLEDKANKLSNGETLSGKAEVVQEEMIEPAGQEEEEDAAGDIELFQEIEEAPVQVEALELDSELVEIFVAEAAELMQTYGDFIARAERGPISITPELRAALHTLKGSSSMAEISNIAPIAVQLDGLVNHLSGRKIKTDQQLTALLKRGHELISEAIGKLDFLTAIPVDGTDQLLAELEDFRSSAGAGSDEDAESDQQVSQLFSFDGIHKLLESEEILRRWKADELGSVVAELDLLIDRSDKCGEAELNSLVNCLRAAYGPLSISHPPAEIALTGLRRGHNHLIETLDRVAAGLEVLIDESIMTTLRNLAESGEDDLLSAEPIQFVQEAWLCLNNMDAVIQQWKEDIHNSLELEKLYDYVNSLAKLAQNAEERIMVELCDRILLVCSGLKNAELTPVDADPGLFESCHQQLVDFLGAVQQSEEMLPNESLLLELDQRVAARASEETVSIEPKEEEQQPVAAVETGVEEPEEEIDEEILSIFLEEADELIESIDQSILQWNGQRSDSVPLENLLRYLHTMKGGARLAGLSSMGEFVHNFETDLISVQQGKVPVDDSLFAGLNKGQDEISRRVEIYRKLAAGQASAEERASLTLAPATPQKEDVATPPVTPTAPPTSADAGVGAPEEEIDEEIDEEILSIFLEEADELIENIDQSILQWNGQRGDSVPLNNLLRYLHTLKGGARLAGLSSLGEFVHNFETDLMGVQQGKVPVDDSLFAGLNKGQDEISRRIEIYKKTVTGEASTEERASATRTPATQPADDTADAPATTTETPAETEAPEVEEPKSEQPKPAKAASQQQEVVRVSAELLDDLVGMAGESSITRGLIEQQINDFGDNLEELELTINHVRDQVRRLEIETESRETVFRSRVDSDGEFDELEMDQYTQLQEISRSLAESVSDLMEHKETLNSKSRDAEILLQQQSRLSNEMQEGLTRTMMVPFSRMIPRLRRIVRQISDELGKKIRFDAFNVEGDLDRNVLERIVAPLEHMLRNAVDHGIESTEVRKKLGKSEEGRISLRLSREAGYFVLQISDDGSGIDVHKVRRKAIDNGMLAEDAQVTNQEVLAFVMRAGFSTAEKLTQISGRGVGMDVVDSELKQLGGTVTIDSTPGKGTEFTIRIPFTVSITRALMVNVGDEVYAIPLNSIEGIVRVSPYELEAYYQPDAPKFEYANQAYKLVYMGRVLEKSGDPNLEGQIALLPVLLARTGDSAVAFQVDRVIGSREVVVKSIGPQFNEVTGISGASILGDGSVVVILDLMALLRSSYESEIEPEYVTEEPVEVVDRVRTVMVVDDSVTVRKVTSRLIERQGWDVILAKDGVDAMDQLQELMPDIMLLDIEMPRMDGFEVLRTVRHDDRMKELPIVMITSRTGEKHKTQAVELGVDRYLGKPFQETVLISTIEEVLAERKS